MQHGVGAGLPPWQIPPMRLLGVLGSIVVVALGAGHASADAPLEMLDEAKVLMAVGACGKGELPPKVKPETVAAHCKKVTADQEAYKTSWVSVAAPFFKTIVPAGIPKTVVYPFAGGDLSTALTVYPDAEEITTLALEPAGDPRAINRLDQGDLRRALAVVQSELNWLYKQSYSKTMNMINAMRAGYLPTQLVFSLSALHMHGYELTGMRYFKLDNAGEIVYLTAADVEKLDKIRGVGERNRGYGNVELRFRKPGAKKDQIYRHIMANIDNNHLGKWDAPLKHLQKKGRVSAMTKAASYLISYGDFSKIRNYLIDNVEWMISDSTGVPPSYGIPAGFEYETWGKWRASFMLAGPGGDQAKKSWIDAFAKDKRPLAFRFGYPAAGGHNHMAAMKRVGKPSGATKDAPKPDAKK
jgi:hypothetical protein